MKIQNLFLFLALFAFFTLLAVGQRSLSESYLKKMTDAITAGDFEGFRKIADSFLTKLLFPPFNLCYLKLNAAILEGDHEKTEQAIRSFSLVNMNEYQKSDLYHKIFNHYMSEKDYEKAKVYLDKIEKEVRNPDLKEQDRYVYDIYALNSAEHIDKLLAKREETPEKERGFLEMLISDSYRNRNDIKNADRYKEMSIRHLKQLEESIRKTNAEKQK